MADFLKIARKYQLKGAQRLVHCLNCESEILFTMGKGDECCLKLGRRPVYTVCQQSMKEFTELNVICLLG